jgi:hypothetical protein
MNILFLRRRLPFNIKNPKIFYDRLTWTLIIIVFYLLNEFITFYYHDIYKNQKQKMKKSEKIYILHVKKQIFTKKCEKTIMIIIFVFIIKKRSMVCMVIK